MSAKPSDVSELEAAADEQDQAGPTPGEGPASEPEGEPSDAPEPGNADPESTDLATASGDATATDLATASGDATATDLATASGDATATDLATASGDATATDLATASGDAPSDLAAAITERDAYLADLQRVTAEFANFRRQTMKRNTELVAQAASRLARELLPVLDACEAAVSQGVEGIDAVQAQLLGVLTGEGLTVLGTVDEPFDPGFHEAVMSEESGTDGQSAPVVADVLRTGYAWNGRVLRPAMVKVRS